MPSATTSLCVECELQPAKYTCPRCGSRTCSLSCTQAHKASASTTCASGSNGTAPAARGSTSASSAASYPPATDYVPLSRYNESNMLQDYLFLSSLSRTTAEKGREIVRMNLLPPSTSGSNENTHSAANSANGQTRMTNQQRQREQLMKQIHYRKYKVMLLPDGMARRKLNQTSWNPKDRKMTFTVQLDLPNAAKQESGKGTVEVSAPVRAPSSDETVVLHKVDAETSIHHLVLGQIEKLSFPTRKDLIRHKELLGLSSPASTNDRPARHDDLPKWIVSRNLVRRQFGLQMPQTSGVDSEENGDVVVLDVLPKEWKLFVPVFSSRLTNESTVRYLDWWNRKRKWEEANPEVQSAQQGSTTDDQQPQQHVSFSPHPPQKRRTWGAQPLHTDAAEGKVDIPLEDSFRAPDADALANEPHAVEPASIVPSSLLALLSQRLGRSVPPPPPPAADSPVAQQRTNSGQTDPGIPSIGDSANASRDAQSVKPLQQHPLTYIHVLHSALTIHDLLTHAIPDGLSIVEFPVLELRDARTTRTDVDVLVIPYPAMSELQDKQEEASASPSPAVMDDAQAAGTKPSLSMGNPQLPAHGLASLLSGYASDSEQDM